MDHSLQGYLTRRSTDELFAILSYMEISDHPEDIVKLVIAISEERGQDIPQLLL